LFGFFFIDRVGKSALITRIVDHTFDPKYNATVSAEFQVKETKLEINKRSVVANLEASISAFLTKPRLDFI
jgi:GTPase SAR1 family protein